jgi:hypothetical protein
MEGALHASLTDIESSAFQASAASSAPCLTFSPPKSFKGNSGAPTSLSTTVSGGSMPMSLASSGARVFRRQNPDRSG